MRVSMEILAEWLKEYHPVLDVKEGKRRIQNVRMIADNIRISDSTIYLNQISSKKVLCSNGQDYMTVTCNDIEIILNEILDALAYYNDFADQLHLRITEKCPLDEILKVGSEFLNKYLVLADPMFYIYKSFGSNHYLENFSKYKEAIENHMLPLPVLLDINSQAYIRIPNLASYEVKVPSMGINTIVTNLFSISVHRGWLIANNASGHYTQYDYDLQDAFSELLQEWMAVNEQEALHRNREEIFQNLLLGHEIEEKTDERLSVFHWYPNDPMQMYVIGFDESVVNSGFALRRALEHMDPMAFVFFHEKYVVHFRNLNLSLKEDYEEQMSEILKACHGRAGKSPVFYDLAHTRSQYEAAVISYQYALEQRENIVGLQQIFFPYVSSLISKYSVIELNHPGLEELKKYDQENDTILYETLYMFLKNNCNYSTTAQALYIHRNTLLYRMERIKEITNIDLSDYETRLQLEIVYMLES